MDMTAPLVLDLPPETLSALRRSARAEGMSPSEQAVRLLSKSLASDAAMKPCRALGHDPDLLAPLRALFAADLSRATSWADLQDRLSQRGYTFRERGTGLALYCTATAARICKASSLGWSYADLIRRFDAPFPGHSHTHVAERALRRPVPNAQKHPSLFPDPGAFWDDDAEDIILFEDE